MSSLKTALFAIAILGAHGCATAEDDGETLAAADAVPRSGTPAAGSVVDDCDVLIVGGGTGGTAAAIASARVGARTCMTEETDWIGGQLTAQGLNASDDNRYTDTIGSTKTYRRLRALMRSAYAGKANPGGCWVSYLCAEPKVALSALALMTKPYTDDGTLRIFTQLAPTSVDASTGRVATVVLTRADDGGLVTIHPRQTIDATELGDVIKLSGAGYRAGQEPKSDTGEADAPLTGCADCVQAFTYDIALEKRPSGERHVIAKPDGYGVQPWLKGFDHGTYDGKFFAPGGVWEYRRMVAGGSRAELSIMNWSSTATGQADTPFVGGNDYPFANILDKPPAEVAMHLERARQRAMAYVYWLQTEADGHGYANLLLRSDLFGTTTGVAKTPYIRESRRLRALETIKVEHISDFYLPGSSRGFHFTTPVAIGWYPMDMHTNAATGSGWGRGKSLPYEVPMGALVPETLDGLIAGAKNIGTTHMASSAYRLHPIEWGIGEAAGVLAAYAVSWGIEPRAAFANEGHAREYEDRLIADGAPLFWVDDVAPDSAAWRDVQLVAAAGIMRGQDAGTLHFGPDGKLSRAQAAVALVGMLGLQTGSATGVFSDVPADHWAAPAIELLASKGIVLGTGAGKFSPDDPVTSQQMQAFVSRALGAAAAAKAVPSPSTSPMSRADCAGALARAFRVRLSLP